MAFSRKHLCLIFLAATLFCFLIVSVDALPIYLSDELGYLSKAAHLGGHSSYFSTSWSAGYSILIAPIFSAFGVTKTAFKLIYLVNAACISISLLFYERLLRRFRVESNKRLTIISSSFLCFGSWAYAFWMFPNALLGLVVALCAYLLAVDDLRYRFCCLSTLAGLAYLVHPSGLLIGISAMLALMLSKLSDLKAFLSSFFSMLMNGRFSFKSSWHAFLENRNDILCVVIYLSLVAAAGPINSLINISMSGVDKGHYTSMISLVIRSLIDSPFKSLFVLSTALLNGLSSLSMATFGFGIVALLVFCFSVTSSFRQAGKVFVDVDSRIASKKKFLCFISALSLLMLAFSSLLSLEDSEKYQYMFHQRYTAVCLQGLWISGLLFYDEAKSRLGRLTILFCSISPIVASCTVAAFYYQYSNYFSVVDLMPSMSSVVSNQFFADYPIVSSSLVGLPLVVAAQAIGTSPWLWAFIPYVLFAFWGMLDNRRTSINGYSAIPLLRNYVSPEVSAGRRVCLAAFGTQATAWETENKHEFYFPSSTYPRLYNRLTGKSELSGASNCDYLVAPIDFRYASESDQERLLVARRFEGFKIEAIDLDQGWNLLSEPSLSQGSSSLLSSRFKGRSEHSVLTSGLGKTVFAAPLGIEAFVNIQEQASSGLFSVSASSKPAREFMSTVLLTEVNPWRVALRPGKYLITTDSRTPCSDSIQVWSVNAAGEPALLPRLLVGERLGYSLDVLEASSYRFQLRALPGDCVSIPNLFLVTSQ